MQFFALLARNTEKFSDADFAPLLPGEAEQRRTLYAEGAVRQVWNRGDIPGSGLSSSASLTVGLIYALANGWGDQAIDELTVALANPDVQTRMAAANALGHLGTPSAKLALEARLAYETDPTVRTTIEKQMGK